MKYLLYAFIGLNIAIFLANIKHYVNHTDIATHYNTIINKTTNAESNENDDENSDASLPINKEQALNVAIEYSNAVHCGGKPLYTKQYNDKNVIVLQGGNDEAVYGVFLISSFDCEFGMHSNAPVLVPVVRESIHQMLGGQYHIPRLLENNKQQESSDTAILTDNLLKIIDSEHFIGGIFEMAYDENKKALTIHHRYHDADDSNCCPTLNYKSVIDFSDWQNPTMSEHTFLGKVVRTDGQYGNDQFNY